jgi:hypothetical protein
VGTPQVSIAADFVPASVSGTNPITRTIQWLLDGVNQGSTYTPGVGTDGQTLAVKQIETNLWGVAEATSAGAIILAAPPEPVAPAYVAGVMGIPVIRREPAIGSTCNILAGVLSLGSPAPAITYQWYRRDEGGAEEAITGATNSTYVPTNADLLRELMVRETATNASGSASNDSYWVRVVPAGRTTGQGAGTLRLNSDPATAAAYDPNTLYRAGQVVDVAGTKYILYEPYAFNIAPGSGKLAASGAAYWYALTGGIYYIDLSLGTGSDGALGTSAAAPWGSMDAVRKKVTASTTGYSAAAANSLFLFKTGSSNSAGGPGQLNITNQAKPLFFGTYGGTVAARPKIELAPQIQSVMTSLSQVPNGFRTQSSAALISARYFDLELDGMDLVSIVYTNTSGVLAVGDTMTYSTPGRTGIVRHLFTSNTGALNAWVEIPLANGRPTTGTFTVSGGAKSGNVSTITYITGIGGFAGGTSRSSGWGVFRCKVTRFTSHGILSQAYQSLDPLSQGDITIVDCEIGHCCTHTGQGAGIDGGAGIRFRAWFNTVYNCGTTGELQNHNIYISYLFNSSLLFNNSYMDANYGSSAFVYHGNMNRLEVGYNRFAGCRVGIAVNDGYASAEEMYDIHVHHNLVEAIGTFGNTSASLAWDFTSVVGTRIHHNVTRNCASVSAFYQGRASGGADSYLSLLVLAHNVWEGNLSTASVYWGTATSGANAELMTDILAKNNIFITASSYIPFRKGRTLPDAQLEQDYNLYFRTGGSTVITWDYNTGGSYDTTGLLSAAHPGFEDHGVTADPLFVNVAALNFNLGALSQARNAGTDVRRQMGMAADWEGNDINTTAPHIGALQTA